MAPRRNGAAGETPLDSGATAYLAGQTVSDEQIGEWLEQFHRDGYLVLRDVLPPDWCAEMRDDLDRILAETGSESRAGIIELHHRMFEVSPRNLSLFDMEPVVTFAERLINNVTHVIHNNSFRVQPGPEHGITGWHQDDAPHYLVTHGNAPTNVRLPVLLFTANYYLTDVETPEYGPTEVLPGSHLFGKPCPRTLDGTEWEHKTVPCCGRAGTVVMFNNQVWHRGHPNLSDRVRYITQVSYARRLVGHKYYPFMNYQMPEHVYRDADERRKRLLGFLPRGAYG
jgi:ectoine hydroxylase-related dioxygenase (phytanoyl-CoA dioxygenase family)